MILGLSVLPGTRSPGRGCRSLSLRHAIRHGSPAGYLINQKEPLAVIRCNPTDRGRQLVSDGSNPTSVLPPSLRTVGQADGANDWGFDHVIN